jgi:hypothetical protein
MSGQVVIDGTSIQVENGFAYRDHSVGPRDLRNLAHNSWCNGLFPSGRSFGSLRVGHLDGTFTDRAFVTHANVLRDAAIIDIPSMENLRADPRQFKVELSVGGETVTLVGALLPDRRSNFTITGSAEWALGTDIGSPSSYFLAQRLARWSWDGEVGYGMSDRGGLIGRFV